MRKRERKGEKGERNREGKGKKGSLHWHCLELVLACSGGGGGSLDNGGGGEDHLVDGVLGDKVGQVLDSRSALVLEHVLMGSGELALLRLEQHDGGKVLEAEFKVLWEVVGDPVKLGNDNLVIEFLVLLGQDLVLGGQVLAGPAPGGVDLEEHVDALIQDDVLERVVDHHLDWVGRVGGGDGLRLEGGLEAAGKEGLDMVNDGLGLQGLSVDGELAVDLIGELVDDKGGPFLLQVQDISVLTKAGGRDEDGIEAALEGTDGGLQNWRKGLFLLLGLVKEVSQRDPRVHVEGIVVGPDLVDQGNTFPLHKGLHACIVKLVPVVADKALVKLFVDGKGGGRELTKGVLHAVLVGQLGKVLALLAVLGKVGDDDDLVAGHKLGKVLLGQFDDGGGILLEHVADDAGRLARTLVWAGLFAVAEELDGRVALNLELLTNLLLLGAVDGAEVNVGLDELLGGGLEFRCKVLAVSTPYKKKEKQGNEAKRGNKDCKLGHKVHGAKNSTRESFDPVNESKSAFVSF